MNSSRIYILFISCIAVCGLSSCELANELDDYAPLYSLDADLAIKDESTAELALTGVYAGFRQRSTSSGLPELYLIPSLMSGTLVGSQVPNPEILGFMQNNPLTDAQGINLGAYSKMYDVINRANWLIEKVENLSDDKFNSVNRKTEILAEARCLRATANFYLLRLWGQFYDTDSSYGIVLRNSPARNVKPLPRSNVSDSYAAILADLDFAIANAPALRRKFYTNNTYAKALKSKVMLYRRNYDEAAQLSGEIISSSNSEFRLADNYQDIFINHATSDLFNSPEILFGTKGTGTEGIGIGNFIGAYFSTINPTFVTNATDTINLGSQQIAIDQTRISSTVFGAAPFLDTHKYRDATGPYEMIYHLRMAEVYLIYAEAEARSNGAVTAQALDALNEVRIRAGADSTEENGFVTYQSSISFEDFLRAVRVEKYTELGAEAGEEWFDLVRYHFEDGLDVSTVNPTANDPDKFILPIDESTIESGDFIVEQNPTY